IGPGFGRPGIRPEGSRPAALSSRTILAIPILALCWRSARRSPLLYAPCIVSSMMNAQIRTGPIRVDAIRTSGNVRPRSVFMETTPDTIALSLLAENSCELNRSLCGSCRPTHRHRQRQQPPIDRRDLDATPALIHLSAKGRRSDIVSPALE